MDIQTSLVFHFLKPYITFIREGVPCGTHVTIYECDTMRITERYIWLSNELRTNTDVQRPKTALEEYQSDRQHY